MRAKNKLLRIIPPMEMAKLKCASPPKLRGKSFLLAKEKDICTAGTVSEYAIYLTAFERKKPGKRLIPVSYFIQTLHCG